MQVIPNQYVLHCAPAMCKEFDYQTMGEQIYCRWWTTAHCSYRIFGSGMIITTSWHKRINEMKRAFIKLWAKWSSAFVYSLTQNKFSNLQKLCYHINIWMYCKTTWFYYKLGAPNICFNTGHLISMCACCALKKNYMIYMKYRKGFLC